MRSLSVEPADFNLNLLNLNCTVQYGSIRSSAWFKPRDPMPRHLHHDASSCQRYCPEFCCIIEVQASRLLFCRIFLYIQQFISVVFVAYVGAGTEGISLWLGLFTSLGGVILGTEISRVLNLHVFYSQKATSEDLHFIDLKHQQRLLSRLRLGLLLCGLSNLTMAFARTLNYYGMNYIDGETQTSASQGFTNFTSWFQTATNWTSWEELGLVDCKDDCVGVGNIQNHALFRSCLADCGCDDLTSTVCKDCFDGCALDASTEYLKCLDDCVQSHLFVAIVFGFMGLLQVSCFVLARLIVYGRQNS